MCTRIVFEQTRQGSLALVDTTWALGIARSNSLSAS